MQILEIKVRNINIADRLLTYLELEAKQVFDRQKELDVWRLWKSK